MLNNEQSHMAPMVTNKEGGNQSQLKHAYTLVPLNSLAEVAQVLHTGASKYGIDNWKLIPTDDHLNHALHHIFLHLAGNTTENHLAHATTRMMMAHEMNITQQEH